MGLGEFVKDVSTEVKDLFAKIIRVETQIEGMDKTVDRLRDDQQQFISELRVQLRDVKDATEEMSKRIATLEGLTDSTYKKALKEALLTLAREHIEKNNGSIEGFNPGQLLGDG